MSISGRILPLLGGDVPLGRKMERCMNESSQFLLYTARDGAVKVVEVFFREETVWLTRKALAELFGVRRPACGPVVRLAGDHAGEYFFTGGSYTAARHDL